MKRKGIKFSRANLGFRLGQEGDTYMDGREIPSNYVVIVSLKDCEINESTNTYDSSNAEQMPIKAHSRTNMAYGKPRTYSDEGLIKTPVYWVEDGYVYRGSISRPIEE